MTSLEYLASRLPIGLVTFDAERRILSYSEKASDLFGPENIQSSLGKPIEIIHPPASRSKIDWLLRQAEQEEASGYATMLITAPNRLLQLRVVRLRDNRGESGYCLVVYDLTELTSRMSADPSDPEPTSVSSQLVKLPVSIRGHIALLNIAKVSYLQAHGHYTQAWTPLERYFCNMSISELEARLPPDLFVRVHRSYIVNLDFAHEVYRKDDQFVILIRGAPKTEIPISRGNVPRVRKLLGV